jgi:hypothetical protein
MSQAGDDGRPVGAGLGDRGVRSSLGEMQTARKNV